MKAKCLDPKWKYRRACETNLHKTFAIERQRLKDEAKAKESPPLAKVFSVKRAAK